MNKVIGVKFKPAGKVYYFDPNGLDAKINDAVIVETARGMEYGYASSDVFELRDEEIVQPLKPIVRMATEKDYKKHLENTEKKEKAMASCQEKVDKHNLLMKLVDVEYTFDNSKVIFYFTADGRIDFRELVKDLAAVFKTRIELRQIGVRDEAKIVGGIGSCGKGLCCHSWLSDFQPVSVKMAKIQNLSLNPTKISGVCGRLMCCLKYENDTYCELMKGMPDVGEKIKTRDGIIKVIDSNILKNVVKGRLVTTEKSEEGDVEKYSTEVYTYDKKDIKRLVKNKCEKRHSHDNHLLEGLDEETAEELKQLIKD